MRLQQNKKQFVPPVIDFSSYTRYRVANNRIMVKILNVDLNSSPFGIQLTSKDKTEETFYYGVILRVGEGFMTNSGEFIKPNYSVGDVVAFSSTSGADFVLLPEDSNSKTFEDVRVVDLPSIFFVDGAIKRLYVEN